ncbi:MAG: LysM peptidoglycan-binding domain-containing protein, partial [Caldilinea sp. CFX5]|nr:LysM peptidoglycan-binding domain-containing protein [Caldilinea sp. CFX5]
MKLPPPLHHLRLCRQGAKATQSAARLLGLLFLSLVLFITVPLLIFATQPAQAQSDSQPSDQEENGYTYAVQRGDNWYSVSVRTGVSIADLQAANPQAVRASGWLITGEKLFIPTVKPVATTTYTVQPGESWSIIAKKFGIAIGLLKAANPQAVRYDDVLRRYEVLNIPLPEGAVTPEGTPPAETAATTTPLTATTTVTAATAPTVATTTTVTATTESATVAEPTAEPTATETATVAPTATETATAEPTATETVTETPTALPTETAAPESTPTTAAPAAAQCPSDFADYPTAILATLNENGGVDALQSFLTTCNAASPTPLVAQDLTGDGNADLVVIYPNPNISATQPVMDLLILNGSVDGYTVGHQARAESEVNLLGALDINSDGKNDVAWLETTCGADTCFDTIQIYSWDGQSWRPWSAAKITMANAETKLEDQIEASQGLEIILTGGVYGNPAAGPQRSRTEIWGSVGGAPYTLVTRGFAPSNCLYHTVLDANSAFANGAADDFEEAEALYTQATSDTNLVACGQRENEVAELQSFSFYRLALIAAYRGQPDVAADLTGAIAAAYPDSIYAKVSQTWLDAYQANGDMRAACAAVTSYAESNPAASAVLGDYGFANPSFGAADICPVLNIAIPTPTAAASAGAAATTPVTTTEGVTTTAGETTTAVTTAETPIVTATVTVTEALPGADLAACPTDLAGYVDTLPTVLTGAGQDAAAVEGWLRTCNALDDQRGAFRLIDLNDDGKRDALFLPTIVSDLGVGPEGTQGAVLIYHGADDDSYTLAANPEIYGLPTLLTVEDLNADQKTDIAWRVEGCGASCVSEVQIVAWDGTVYTSTIAPGATIAEGTAAFAPIAAGDPGQGKQLVLTGGVSDTEEGGLAVPHTELWQSIDGQPFQRIRWTYDRAVDGANCLGLRLVEADVALQAAPVLGYDPAIDLYTKAIDPSLQACSIFGMGANEELPLLQGLASFRLIQAHALAGDFVAAGEVLTSLSQGQPESGYTKAAQGWLAEYEAKADAAAACAAIQPIFDEETDLWQITDHFGYNHPAL